MADGSLKSGKLSTVRTVRNQAFATVFSQKRWFFFNLVEK